MLLDYLSHWDVKSAVAVLQFTQAHQGKVFPVKDSRFLILFLQKSSMWK